MSPALGLLVTILGCFPVGCGVGTPPTAPFLPAQGLEIVNPQAAEKKVAEASQKYFSSMAEFLKVKGEKNGVMST